MKKLCLIVAVFVSLISCDTIFIDDISTEIIRIVSPTDGIETEIQNQQFLWSEIEGATSYRFQVVFPSFSRSESVIEDKVVYENSCDVELYPGTFEWRVRGENESYNTPWFYGKLTIISTEDLTKQTVNLIAPGDERNVNSDNVTFSWSPISFAEQYEIRIYADVWDGELAVDPIITTKSEILQELPESNIVWGVKAINSFSESTFTKSEITVDITAPDKPQLIYPMSDSTVVESTIEFKWNSSDNLSGVAEDSIFIFSDIDQLTVIAKASSTSEKYSVKIDTEGTYYWYVKSIDNAGNIGSRSDIFKFSN